MTAWPVVIPLTTPNAETEATDGVRLRHSTVALLILLPS
jgi:hypothetical protein